VRVYARLQGPRIKPFQKSIREGKKGIDRKERVYNSSGLIIAPGE